LLTGHALAQLLTHAECKKTIVIEETHRFLYILHPPPAGAQPPREDGLAVPVFALKQDMTRLSVYSLHVGHGISLSASPGN